MFYIKYLIKLVYFKYIDNFFKGLPDDTFSLHPGKPGDTRGERRSTRVIAGSLSPQDLAPI